MIFCLESNSIFKCQQIPFCINATHEWIDIDVDKMMTGKEVKKVVIKSQCISTDDLYKLKLFTIKKGVEFFTWFGDFFIVIMHAYFKNKYAVEETSV